MEFKEMQALKQQIEFKLRMQVSTKCLRTAFVPVLKLLNDFADIVFNVTTTMDGCSVRVVPSNHTGPFNHKLG